MEIHDFSGWATRNDLLCGDGRTIRSGAFKDQDGATVPLVWNHKHDDPDAVLGHAILENRDEGVYAYCKFNDTPSGVNAKKLVKNGDVRSLSIWANKLQQIGGDVIHGVIRELSLVLAGANPGAFIDSVLEHSDDNAEEAMIISYDENIMLYHSDDKKDDEDDKKEDKKEDKPVEKDNKTVKEVIDSMNEEQKTVLYGLVGEAAKAAAAKKEEKKEDEVKHSVEEEGGDVMKTNVFDQDQVKNKNVLSHADEEKIVALAKQSGVGSLKTAIEIVTQEKFGDQLAHGFENYGELFPEYELLKKGAPELITRDQSWVSAVMQKIHKSPISRIRTRQADARIAELQAKGYQKKGDEKTKTANIKMIGRTTDPQTIYIKDDMHRDDIIDVTDFGVVEYNWNIMRMTMNETLALAALVGDGREEGDPDKIHETHIRSIWNDDELYTIHADVDIAAARAELQGTNTNANFGENYIYAEAIITKALYSREKFKGSGTPDLYCTPHLLNVMLLARDLNGRRIYDSKADLAKALNVGEIHTIEQFEGRTRTDEKGNTKKLLGLFVNLADYQFGATKGGEVTRFEDFDMDFNKYKYMLETRLSGSLTKLWSAIALEELVETEGAEG